MRLSFTLDVGYCRKSDTHYPSQLLVYIDLPGDHPWQEYVAYLDQQKQAILDRGIKAAKQQGRQGRQEIAVNRDDIENALGMNFDTLFIYI